MSIPRPLYILIPAILSGCTAAGHQPAQAESVDHKFRSVSVRGVDKIYKADKSLRPKDARKCFPAHIMSPAGTVVGPRVTLTAAHVAEKINMKYQVEMEGQSYNVDCCVHPGYVYNELETPDIAVCRFSSPEALRNKKPFEVIDLENQATQVLLTGYGCTHPFLGLKDVWVDNQNPMSPYIIKVSDICPGDSGSAAFIVEGDGLVPENHCKESWPRKIVGVNATHRCEVHGEYNCSLLSSTAAVRPWLKIIASGSDDAKGCSLGPLKICGVNYNGTDCR